MLKNRAKRYQWWIVLVILMLLGTRGRDTAWPAESPSSAAAKARAIQMLKASSAVFIENQGQWDEPAVRFALTSPAAIADGARWRRTSTIPWLDSGATETAIPTGPVTVVFKDLPDWATPIVADADGNCYVTGWTSSSGWLQDGESSTYKGGYDAFLTKLSPSGQSIWGTYLGGTGADQGNSVALGDFGTIYIGGQTASSGWIYGGYDTTYGGGNDGFIVQCTGQGRIVWSTYLGGAASDYVSRLAVNGKGEVCAVGTTYSNGWVSGARGLPCPGRATPSSPRFPSRASTSGAPTSEGSTRNTDRPPSPPGGRSGASQRGSPHAPHFHAHM